MIVVGVDGSDSARAALRFALDEARLRGAPVRLVLAWQLPDPQTAAPLERALDEIGGAGDLDVETIVREGPPASVLLEEAKDADLLVLGSRGVGGFRGLMLGSVSQQCAHHAPCPVVIVPHAREL